MGYSINDKLISLNALCERIKSTDLVPSRAILLEGIDEKFIALKNHGIETYAGLRTALKTPKRMEELAGISGISAAYLNLLRREIESYLPKPIKLTAFDWMPVEELQKLIKHGIKDSKALFKATQSETDTAFLQTSSTVDMEILKKLRKLCSLTRVQWVSPTTARMIILCGYDSPEELAAANGDDLFAGFNRVNADNRFFKGTIGLRDCKRLIHAAKYVEG